MKAFLAMLISAGVLQGQSDWEQLTKLRQDSKVKVYLADGRIAKGQWQPTGSGEFAVRVKDGSTLLLHQSNVDRITTKSRTRGALWGGLVTFAAAAPVGAFAGPYVADYGNPSARVRAQYAAGWGMFFGGAGAGIGALLGSERTVYRR